MWRSLIVLAGGCSFSATSAPVSLDDAQPAAADARPDAPLLACDIGPIGTPVSAGLVGPGGGSTRPDVVCAAGEVPIGFDFVRQNSSGLIATHVRCGALARDAGTTITTSPAERAGDNGSHGTCIVTGGTTTVEEQTCASGEVLVGITVNNIGSSYNSFTMTCQALSATTLEPSGDKTSVPFPKSGTETSALESAGCAPGMVIVSFGLKSGCDQEQLDVRCANVACL